jgi:hypothetical protein
MKAAIFPLSVHCRFVLKWSTNLDTHMGLGFNSSYLSYFNPIRRRAHCHINTHIPSKPLKSVKTELISNRTSFKLLLWTVHNTHASRTCTTNTRVLHSSAASYQAPSVLFCFVFLSEMLRKSAAKLSPTLGYIDSCWALSHDCEFVAPQITR